MRIALTQLVRAVGELEKAGTMSPHDLAQAVKHFLIRKRLTKRTGKIIRALEQYEAKAAGIVTVKVTTAHSLPQVAEELVNKKAETLFAPEKEIIKLSFHEDPKLLGGIQLETDSARYDLTLKRAIKELRKSLCQ